MPSVMCTHQDGRPSTILHRFFPKPLLHASVFRKDAHSPSESHSNRSRSRKELLSAGPMTQPLTKSGICASTFSFNILCSGLMSCAIFAQTDTNSAHIGLTDSRRLMSRSSPAKSDFLIVSPAVPALILRSRSSIKRYLLSHIDKHNHIRTHPSNTLHQRRSILHPLRFLRPLPSTVISTTSTHQTSDGEPLTFSQMSGTPARCSSATNRLSPFMFLF